MTRFNEIKIKMLSCKEINIIIINYGEILFQVDGGKGPPFIFSTDIQYYIHKTT